MQPSDGCANGDKEADSASAALRREQARLEGEVAGLRAEVARLRLRLRQEEESAAAAAAAAAPTTPTEELPAAAPAPLALIEVVNLPSGSAGFVIGSGGRTIRRLKELTGCELWVKDKEGTQLVELTASSQEALDQARSLVMDLAAARLLYEDLAALSCPGHCAQAPSPASLRYLSVATPLSRQFYVSVHSEDGTEHKWESWCPSCRRPLDIQAYGDDVGRAPRGALGETLPMSAGAWPSSASAGASAAPEAAKYAYVAAIWGNHPGFVLGALVLGHALARTSAGGLERVLLHTWDVGEAARKALAHVWTLKHVSYIDATERCFAGGKGGRFAGTFTKLHAMGLSNYVKVLLLDIDLVILESLDHLFELQAPAALARGPNDKAHGARVDGRRFFLGDDGSGDKDWWEWCWGQNGGINAGVVLLEPNDLLFQRAKREVMQELHPEHIPGSGPEQDYLSRFYAPYWSHISVKYNYQLHHVFYGLESVLPWWTASKEEPREDWLPARLKLPPEEVAVIHFSGTLKMWDRDYSVGCHAGAPGESDADFAERILRSCSPACYERWVERSAGAEAYAPFNVAVEECGAGGRKFWAMAPATDSVYAAADARQSVEPLVAGAVGRAAGSSLRAAVRWREDFESLLAAHPILGNSARALLETLGKAASPAEAPFWIFQPVEVFWGTDGTWYPAVVTEVHRCGRVDVTLALDGWWGRRLAWLKTEHVRDGSAAGISRWRTW